MLASIVFNYLIGSHLAMHPNESLLALVVTGNIKFLNYFKHAGFVKTTGGAAFDMVSMALL